MNPTQCGKSSIHGISILSHHFFQQSLYSSRGRGVYLPSTCLSYPVRFIRAVSLHIAHIRSMHRWSAGWSTGQLVGCYRTYDAHICSRLIQRSSQEGGPDQTEQSRKADRADRGVQARSVAARGSGSRRGCRGGSVSDGPRDRCRRRCSRGGDDPEKYVSHPPSCPMSAHNMLSLTSGHQPRRTPSLQFQWTQQRCPSSCPWGQSSA